ncbi:MAG: hypothetical protein LQ337_006200 [Flavoplaca oasis]|nr:MAG: hypothetical protein LQ337_006200 [Flavoplaca oasis]
MPPVSPPSDQQDTTDDHSPLSDEDVAILYEIITRAVQDSNVDAQPFRAIFTSYDTILAQHGLSPDHDQIYLRFLLRLGGRRRAGETLYDSFEALLAELGIQIEVNVEQNEIQDVTRSVEATARNSAELQARSEAGSDSGVHSRRASFHTSADTRREAGAVSNLRSSSRASISDYREVQVEEANVRPSTRASIRPSERFERRRTPRQTAGATGTAGQTTRGRLTAKEFASNLQHVQRRHASASATRTSVGRDRNNAHYHSRVQSQQLPSTQLEEGPTPARYEYQDFTQDTEHRENGHDRPNNPPERHLQAYQVDSRELFYQPTKAQLLRDADDFMHFRLRALAHNALRRWQSYAQESHERHERMSEMALNHDLSILLRQSFDQWRAVLQSRRRALAADRYFSQLEHRAHRARDLYLLIKAFTHWQQISNERVKDALKARHQVLRVKYFNAWLDLTVLNHHKVHLLGQRKFFHAWRQRYLDSTKITDLASKARRRNLIRTTYWKWFWAFCERRAPKWKEKRLQSTIFNRWSLTVQRALYREYEVGVRRDDSIKRALFFKWLQQARSVLSHTTEADDFCRQKIIRRSMLAYKRTIKFTPLVKQVSNMADWRVAGSTFAFLVNRVRTAQQAKQVDQLRVLKDSWTAWNDRLRWQTLEARVDDRVLVQTLYTWVLAERCVLLQRLREQRLSHLNLRRLVDRYRTRVSAERVICEDFEKKRQACTSRIIINRWHRAVDSFRHNAHMALEFEAPRILQETILAWTKKLNYIRRIDEEAADASYYFRTVRCLRRWRIAAAEAKRRRYRDAYAHIRRRSKMKLASNCLQVWRSRAHANNQMQEQARSHDQQQLLRYSASLFDHWRSRHDFLIDRQNHTLTEFDQRFANDQLGRWIARYRTQAQLQGLAEAHAGLRVSTVASNWLHKLQLRVIELKGRESNVELFRRRSKKRHLRVFLRRWGDKFASMRDQQRCQEMDGQDRAARPAGQWTDMDEGLEIGDWIPGSNTKTSSTPFAAHLSTPSRRAARAKEVLQMSTTPAGTPSATRMLSQLGRTPRSVRRGEFGRSTAGFNGRAFGPIEETPKTP